MSNLLDQDVDGAEAPRLNHAVLVVDDDLGVRVLLEKWLSAAGCQVVAAAEGREAIRALETRDFDLMLTDIIMPDREGIETMLEVRQRWPQCRIVAMSGGGRVGAEQFLTLAGQLGADATIKKPFRREALLGLIMATLAKAPRALWSGPAEANSR